MLVKSEIVALSQIFSQLLSQNQSIYAETKVTFVITFTFTRVQRPKYPIMFRLSTSSGPPRSRIVINKIITSYNICKQLSLAKTKDSTLYNQRVRWWLCSLSQELKNRSVPSCLDYQQSPVLKGLGQSSTRQKSRITFAVNCIWRYQSFSSLQSESASGITFKFTRVQKPKCPITFRLATGSGFPRFGIVINKTINSYNISEQVSFAKTKASTLCNQRLLSWLHSTSQEYKNRSVLSCLDYQQLTVLPGLW